MSRANKHRLRLPKLSRRGKILRNVAVSLLVGVLLWGMADYPLPTRLAYRRLEREHFIQPADIKVVCTSAADWRKLVYAQGDGKLYWGLISDGQSGFLTAMDWSGEPMLLCNGWMMSDEDGLAAAVLGAPESAVTARLEMTLQVDKGTEVPGSLWSLDDQLSPETWTESYVATAQKQDDVFRFQIDRHYPEVTFASTDAQRKAWNYSECEYWSVVYGMTAEGREGMHCDVRVECYDANGEVVMRLEQNDETGLAADFWAEE